MKNIWLSGLVLLYLMACFWPGVEGVSPPGYMYLCTPFAWMVPAWSSNPLFFLGCFALSRKNGQYAACALGMVATMLASTFFFMMYPKFGLSIFEVPGVDCWLLSMVLLAASGFLKLEERADELEKPAPIDEV